jgi:hypothetical protein
MAVSTPGKMSIKRHHIEEERRRISPGYRSGEHVQFLNDAIPFAEQCDKLVGMTVAPQLEEEREKFMSDTANIHDSIPCL